MSTHTPGPWTRKFGSNVYQGCGHSTAGRLICVTEPTNGTAEDLEEAWANANLIAAAPDLLEALVYARDEIAMRVGEDGGDAYSVKKACRKIDEAIAKAEGRKVKP